MLIPTCCQRNTNTISPSHQHASHYFIFDAERFLRRNPSHKSNAIPTKILDLRNKMTITSTPYKPLVSTQGRLSCGVQSAPFAGEEGRRVCSSNDGRGNPASFCGKCTATYFCATTGTTYSEFPDLVPVREILRGSGLRRNCVITCLPT